MLFWMVDDDLPYGCEICRVFGLELNYVSHERVFGGI